MHRKNKIVDIAYENGRAKSTRVVSRCKKYLHKDTSLLLLFVLVASGILLFMANAQATDISSEQSSNTILRLTRQIQALQARLSALGSGLASASHISYSHVFTQNLQPEATGTEVRALQRFLNWQGDLLSENASSSPAGQKIAYFGTATQKALARFQSANSISPATGYFGPKTRSYINPEETSMIIVASSSDHIYSYPHATTQINDNLVIGTVHENPAHIVIFTNPNDLSQYIATTTPGYMDLADVVYDGSHNRLYFVSSRTNNKYLEILSVDPATLAWTPVFEFDAGVDVGFPALDSDGTYIYVATQSDPAYILKIRISDWSLAAVHAFSDLQNGFHSSQLYEFPAKTEWYIVTFSIPTMVFKVNTADFSYTKTVLLESGDITNEIYFRDVDDKSGLLYLPSENAFGLDVINTATMADTHYATPGSYGVASDGVDLYSLDPYDHQIIDYRNFDINRPLLIKSPLPVNLNDWFETSNGNTYFTDFNDPSVLYQYSIKHKKL